MANLEFCDKHNMVAYLKKPSGSEGFQEIVDFLNGSHIRYALTKNPTIYVSLIKKFWQTATVRTVDNREQEITATVDGKEFTVTEASVRRHLQLADVDIISVLPTTKFFDQHSLIGEHIPNVPDEAVYKEWDFRVERDTTTAASLDAEQASGNINRTQSTTIPNVPLPQGIGVGGSPRCQEAIGGSIAQTRSERKVESLEADLKQTKQVYGATYSKLIMKVKSTAKVLADAANTNVHTYIRRRRVVSTRSGGISTAAASMPVSTAGMVQEVNISIPSPVIVKDKAPSFTEEEWENIKARVEANEELSKRLQAEERNRYIEVDQAKMLLKRYSFDELNELFKTTMKNVNTFVPMEIKDKGRASELVNRSSQATIIDFAEAGSSKRAAEAELDHEGSKRQKTNEALRSIQEQPEEEEKELLQEDLQQMMMIIRVGNHTEAYQFFKDILKIFDRDDLVMLWNLVKERFSSTKPTDDKERTLWVELKRLFEPNTDDTLWKLQRYMHDPLKWRLYDTCGVHHMSTERGIDIFMLVEKEYPLSKGVQTLMLVNKLLVEQHSEMTNELLRKIFI
ncbi:hypothetical protein Tco_0828732 [Tanacetum coccineum]